MEKEYSQILVNKGNGRDKYIGEFDVESFMYVGFRTPHLDVAKIMIEKVVADCIEKGTEFELKISEKFGEDDWIALNSVVSDTFQKYGINPSGLF